MRKQELIDAVAEKTGFTKKDAKLAVEAVLDGITESLAKGDSVQIVGFGKFEVRERQERTGRNPQTGAELLIPAHNKPAFKASSTLKKAVQ